MTSSSSWYALSRAQSGSCIDFATGQSSAYRHPGIQARKFDRRRRPRAMVVSTHPVSVPTQTARGSGTSPQHDTGPGCLVGSSSDDGRISSACRLSRRRGTIPRNSRAIEPNRRVGSRARHSPLRTSRSRCTGFLWRRSRDGTSQIREVSARITFLGIDADFTMSALSSRGLLRTQASSHAQYASKMRACRKTSAPTSTHAHGSSNGTPPAIIAMRALALTRWFRGLVLRVCSTILTPLWRDSRGSLWLLRRNILHSGYFRSSCAGFRWLSCKFWAVVTILELYFMIQSQVYWTGDIYLMERHLESLFAGIISCKLPAFCRLPPALAGSLSGRGLVRFPGPCCSGFLNDGAGTRAHAQATVPPWHRCAVRGTS